MILAASSDYSPGFEIYTWPEGEEKTKFSVFWNPDGHTLDKEGEDLWEHLLEVGSVEFEDGWLKLFKDPNDAVSFLFEKVKEKANDADFEDERRYKEYLRANETEGKLQTLRTVLRDILEDRIDEVVEVMKQTES